MSRVWLYDAGTDLTASPEAVKFCQENGISVVAGHCSYMLLKEAPGFHRFHGYFLKLIGKYPKKCA